MEIQTAAQALALKENCPISSTHHRAAITGAGQAWQVLPHAGVQGTFIRTSLPLCTRYRDVQTQQKNHKVR